MFETIIAAFVVIAVWQIISNVNAARDAEETKQAIEAYNRGDFTVKLDD